MKNSLFDFKLCQLCINDISTDESSNISSTINNTTNDDDLNPWLDKETLEFENINRTKQLDSEFFEGFFN